MILGAYSGGMGHPFRFQWGHRFVSADRLTSCKVECTELPNYLLLLEVLPKGLRLLFQPKGKRIVAQLGWHPRVGSFAP
jgi:hypothetical protein